MRSHFDDKKGLIKVEWQDVRNHVRKLEPTFANIVDMLSPDRSFTLFLAYYPYGSIDADTQSTLFPDDRGAFYRITDIDAPKDVVRHLGYSQNTTPLAMVLEKQVECFIDLKSKRNYSSYRDKKIILFLVEMVLNLASKHRFHTHREFYAHSTLRAHHFLIDYLV